MVKGCCGLLGVVKDKYEAYFSYLTTSVTLTAESEVDTKVLVLSHSTNRVAYERDRLN